MSESDNIIAKRLREFRGTRTQRQIADVIGITQSAYSLWEVGRRNKKFEDFARLCQRLNISADWLLGLTDERKSLRIEGDIAELQKKTDEIVQAASEMRQKLKVIDSCLRK